MVLPRFLLSHGNVTKPNSTMKTAAILSLLTASANAFAPSSNVAQSSALNMSPELDGMVGVSVELGSKPVSTLNSFTNKQI